MSTRAIKFLTQKDISFEVVPYDHQQKGAKFASQAIGFPLAKTVKTLVADLGPKGCALVLRFINTITYLFTQDLVLSEHC